MRKWTNFDRTFYAPALIIAAFDSVYNPKYRAQFGINACVSELAPGIDYLLPNSKHTAKEVPMPR